jgi:hypothetical protein
MRIYQRTGKDTGVSYSLGAVLFGVFMLVGLAYEIGESVWKTSPASLIFLVVILALVAVAFWGLRRSATTDEREHRRLAALEQMERARNDRDVAEAARVADLQRLKAKYKA